MEIKVKIKEGKMKESKTEMEKPITSFGFAARKDVDKKVLSLVNTYSSLSPGIPALSLLRNLLLRILPDEINRIQDAERALKAS